MGAGKTEIFISMISRLLEKKPDARVVICLNRVKLLKQTARRLIEVFGAFNVGIYCGSLNQRESGFQITVGLIDSIYDVPMDGVSLVVLDEVHNVDQRDGRYKKWVDTMPGTKVFGVTATPYRQDGYIYGEGRWFDRITYQKSFAYMIDRGFLVRPVLKASDCGFDIADLRVTAGEYNQKDVEEVTRDATRMHRQIQDALRRLDGRKKVVWMCSSIEHAKRVTEALVEYQEKAVCLTSDIEGEEQDRVLREFEDRDTRHLVFISMVSEGYDYPPIDAVCLLRPTRSAARYVQTVGRGLRLSDGKENCLVLDYANVVSTLGPIDKPIVFRSGGKNGENTPGAAMKFCPKCLTYMASFEKQCADCGHIFYVDPTRRLTPDQNGSILGNEPKPVIVDVSHLEFARRNSKSGNDMVIIYWKTVSGPILDTVAEYFVLTAQPGVYRLKKRLESLGIDPKSDIQTWKPVKMPKQMEVLFEKYPKVIRLIFDEHGEEDRKRDPGLSQPST